MMPAPDFGQYLARKSIGLTVPNGGDDLAALYLFLLIFALFIILQTLVCCINRYF
jgi:hypothetical protein